MMEREAFERMMKSSLDRYFALNAYDLIVGNILIQDDGSAITIYNKRTKEKDWKIVY